MLAAHAHAPPSSPPPFAFLPARPSPLSPRSANIYGSRVFMSSSTRPSPPAGQENQDVPFAKRAVKKAPSPKHDELKERRRNLFLKNVKQGREDKRFEARGEDIMRLDFVRRRRQWEAEQARDAPFIPSDPPEPEEDEHDLPSSSDAMEGSQLSAPLSAPEEVADEVAQMEDEEIQALLEYMPVDEGQPGAGQNLWSDDDDYEELFSELMEQDGGQGREDGAQKQDGVQAEGEAMDTS